MAYNQKAAAVAEQEFFEDVHREDVEIVRRLVKNQEIRVGNQKADEKNALSLPAAQCRKHRMLDFSLKAEFVQEKRRAQNFSVIHFDYVCTFLNVFKNGEVQVFENRILLVVAEERIFALHNLARIRLQIPRDDVEQCRFSRAVSAEDSDFLALAERVREIFQNRRIRFRLRSFRKSFLEIFRYSVQLKDFSAKPSSRDLKLKSLVLREFLAVDELHVVLDSRLLLRSARTRASHEPVALEPEDGLDSALRVLFDFRLDFFFFKVRRIISLIELEFSACKLVDVVAHSVKKISVVCHHEDAARSFVQVILKPVYRLNVQMVRRLVKQKELRVLDENLRKRDFLQHSARKSFHLTRKVIYAESSENRFYLRLVIPKVSAVHVESEFVEPRLLRFGKPVRHFIAQILVFVYQHEFRAVRLEYVFPD